MADKKPDYSNRGLGPLADLPERVGEAVDLDPPVASQLELASVVANGLPNGVVAALIRRGISEADVFRTVLPRRTYHRRRAENGRLTAEESDRAERVARLLALAQLIFDDQVRAARWLSKPKQRFDRHSPIELMRTGVGARVVEELLLQSYFGFSA